MKKNYNQPKLDAVLFCNESVMQSTSPVSTPGGGPTPPGGIPGEAPGRYRPNA